MCFVTSVPSAIVKYNNCVLQLMFLCFSDVGGTSPYSTHMMLQQSHLYFYHHPLNLYDICQPIN